MPQAVHFLESMKNILLQFHQSNLWNRNDFNVIFSRLKNSQNPHMNKSGCSIIFFLKKYDCNSCCRRRCIVTVKHMFANNHLLKNFWKTFSSVLVNCNYLLFFQFNGFDSTCTSEEQDVHYFFHCSLYFHHCWFEIIFKNPYFTSLTCWNIKKVM